MSSKAKPVAGKRVLEPGTIRVTDRQDGTARLEVDEVFTWAELLRVLAAMARDTSAAPDPAASLVDVTSVH